MSRMAFLLALCLPVSGQSVWNAAKARVLANGGNARILCIGDSTTQGGGSANQTTAYPAALATSLTAAGLPANINSWYGGAGGTIIDNRVTLGSGWSISAGFSMGGQLITASSATSSLSFTTGTADTVKFWHIRNTGYGTLSYQVDSGSVTNLNDNGAAASLSVTISGLSLAAHTIKFNYVSGGAVYVIGVEAWDSASSSVDVINAGFGGATAAKWITNTGSPWDPSAMIAPIAPDLVLIDLGINDWVNGLAPATFSSQIQTLITAAVASGADVMIVSPIPSNISAAAQVDQQALVNVMITLASTNGLTMINEFAVWQTWILSNSLGFMADTLHPNAAGYIRFAKILQPSLLPVNRILIGRAKTATPKAHVPR